MLNLAWIVLLATFFYFFSSLEANRQNPNRDPETTSYEGQKALLLHPNRQDHYVLNGHINGSEVTLLLDTGATNVAVPGDMAAALGLRRGEPIKVMTANGLANGYRTRIDRLQLGDILLTDVEADIAPGMNGTGAILLGMSALSRIDFSKRDGKLILIQ